MYTYVESEPGLYTVGTYDSGKWDPESDHPSRADAASRVNELNGGTPSQTDKLQRQVEDLQREVAEMSGQINNLARLVEIVVETLIPGI